MKYIYSIICTVLFCFNTGIASEKSISQVYFNIQPKTNKISINEPTHLNEYNKKEILTNKFHKHKNYVTYNKNKINIHPNTCPKYNKNITTTDTAVVITAMSIYKQKRILGFATPIFNKHNYEPYSTYINSSLYDNANISMKPLFLNSVAGLEINQASAIIGSGVNINIRNFSSITGSNMPLIVVDGIPINTDVINFNYEDIYSAIGIQASNRFNDLSSNDIENISVLKSLSSTVLYGELGKNGIILITTKNNFENPNKLKNHFEIIVKNDLQITQIATQYKTPPINLDMFYDNPKNHTVNPNNTSYNQTGKHPYDIIQLNGLFPEYKDVPYIYKNYDFINKFYKPVSIANNSSFTITSKTNTNQINLSFNALNNHGILNTNKVIKYDLGLGFAQKLKYNFTVSNNVKFTTSTYISTPIFASPNSKYDDIEYSLFKNIFTTPISFDLLSIPYENPINKETIQHVDIGQNPLWTLHNTSYTEKNKRLLWQFFLSKLVYSKSKISYRISFDTYELEVEKLKNKGGTLLLKNINSGLGSVINIRKQFIMWDHVLVGSFDTQKNKIKLSLDAGVHFHHKSYTQKGIYGVQQIIFGISSLNNFGNQLTEYEVSSSNNKSSLINNYLFYSLGYFIQTNVRYKDLLYVNTSLRYGVVSSLETSNNKILYPGINLAIYPLEIFNIKSRMLVNEIKLKIGYATSAGAPEPYHTRQNAQIINRQFITSNNSIINGSTINKKLANRNLKPELLQEFEFGIEATFLNKGVTIDACYFYKMASNLILNQPVDISTGYNFMYANGGTMTTQGIELDINTLILKTTKWIIELKNLLYLYRSNVKNLPHNLKQLQLDGFDVIGNFVENNKPHNIIKSKVIKKSPAGDLIINSTTGQYEFENQLEQIANPNPNYKTSSTLYIGWENIYMSAQISYTNGGQVYSATSQALTNQWLHEKVKESKAPNTIVLKGVNEIRNSDNKVVGYQKNTTYTEMLDYSYKSLPESGYEIFVYDASVIRINNISIGFKLNSFNKINPSPIKEIHFNISANNVWFFAPNIPSNCQIDPEYTGLGANTNSRGLELFNGPAVRRYVFGIQFIF